MLADNDVMFNVQDRATTEVEAREIGMQLDKAVFTKILAGPAHLNYGSVSAARESVKYFCMTNTTKHAIHVLVNAKSHDHLIRSQNMNQVVPPQGSAVFQAVLFNSSLKTYSHKVEYIINGMYFFEFEVSASVIPVTLDLNSSELEFKYSVADWLPHVDRVLLLNNANNFAVDYSWQNSAPGLFNVTPMSGTIKAHCSGETNVRWAPSEGQPSTGAPSSSAAALPALAPAVPMLRGRHALLPCPCCTCIRTVTTKCRSSIKMLHEECRQCHNTTPFCRIIPEY